MRMAIPAVALCVLVNLSAAAAERPSVEQLAKFFTDVVFEAEYQAKGSAVVKKWVSPVRIQVNAMRGDMIPKPDGSKELKLKNQKAAPAHVASIRKHLKTLLKITGVKAESAKQVGKKPNLFIKFVPRLAMHAPFLAPGVDSKLLRRVAAPGVCYFLSAAKDGRIVWATIVVNNQMSDRDVDACLLEELTQTFGLPNDSDLVKPSVFNNRAQPTSLNRTDLILIRTLYDRRMEPGTRRADAERLAVEIISELNEVLQ